MKTTTTITKIKTGMMNIMRTRKITNTTNMITNTTNMIINTTKNMANNKNHLRLSQKQ